MKAVIRITLGIVCLVIGIAGLVLPIIPGFVLIAIGLGLLADSYYYDENEKRRK